MIIYLIVLCCIFFDFFNERLWDGDFVKFVHRVFMRGNSYTSCDGYEGIYSLAIVPQGIY